MGESARVATTVVRDARCSSYARNSSNACRARSAPPDERASTTCTSAYLLGKGPGFVKVAFPLGCGIWGSESCLARGLRATHGARQLLTRSYHGLACARAASHARVDLPVPCSPESGDSAVS